MTNTLHRIAIRSGNLHLLTNEFVELPQAVRADTPSILVSLFLFYYKYEDGTDLNEILFDIRELYPRGYSFRIYNPFNLLLCFKAPEASSTCFTRKIAGIGGFTNAQV